MDRTPLALTAKEAELLAIALAFSASTLGIPPGCNGEYVLALYDRLAAHAGGKAPAAPLPALPFSVQ